MKSECRDWGAKRLENMGFSRAKADSGWTRAANSPQRTPAAAGKLRDTEAARSKSEIWMSKSEARNTKSPTGLGLGSAPRAKEKLRSMEQCFGAKAGKHRLLARTLFHDCSIWQARGEGRGARDWVDKIEARCSKFEGSSKSEIRSSADRPTEFGSS